jgi:exodeoxyribonuclease VII large subunit
MQVQARGRLSLYEARGDYQLILDAMEEAGEGQLRAAFEALKKKLQGEGLFDPAIKKSLPTYPERIAVITSPSGAVIKDILNVLKRRWPLAAVRLYPVPVQGQEAPEAICNALSAANRHQWGQALIIGRGGGSLEDLQAFNDESVARAIADSELPVISAVGHETDFSISDFVADLRAPTPSAAAELLAPDGEALKQAFAGQLVQLRHRMQARLQSLSQSHDNLSRRLSQQHPERKLLENRKLLTGLSSRLSYLGQRLVPEKRQILHELARTLNAVSPLPTLERGYAIVSSDKGQILGSVAEVRGGQAVTTQLSDGRIYASVVKTSSETNKP